MTPSAIEDLKELTFLISQIDMSIHDGERMKNGKIFGDNGELEKIEAIIERVIGGQIETSEIDDTGT